MGCAQVVKPKFFKSRYPIVESLMNKGSTLPLAIAVARAGGFPSLFCWENNQSTKADIIGFIDTIQSRDLIVPIIPETIVDRDFIDMINDYQISHCEFLPVHGDGRTCTVMEIHQDIRVQENIKQLRQTTKFIWRTWEIFDANPYPWIDALTIKGKESAGKTGSWSVTDLFVEHTKLNDHIALIPMGGISLPHQVKWYMDHGAAAVSVGTVLAMSQESPLSPSIKLKILGMSSDDIVTRSDTNQNCLIFGNPELEGHWNQHAKLHKAIQGDTSDSLIYIGSGIDNISHVKTCEEIMLFLASDLP